MSLARKPKRINPDEVDPSVYCYDEVYDDMKSEEEQERLLKESTSSTKQGSKYIQGLIETAERRNTEKELRKFKRFAKEREEAQATGELDDEEVFVTSGYKKKLKEMKALEEEARRRLNEEESSSMNFMKTGSKNVDSHSKKDKPQNCDKPATEPSFQSSSTVEDETVNDTTTSKETLMEKQEDKSEEPAKPKFKELKTKEERRAYLEQVLAKRTVGKIFDEKVSSYQARKLRSNTTMGSS